MSSKLSTWITQSWYAAQANQLRWLKPLASLYRCLAVKRREAYIKGKKSAYHPGVPVIIVGNVHVGGGGKSPLVAALALHLRTLGYKPGIVSRGYGGTAAKYPQLVTATSKPEEVGDEPLMLALQTGVPVAVDPNRPAAAQFLVQEHQCDVILSDDGLQHYRLARDLELVVIDASRGLGNGLCLPAGPLREPLSRLSSVDWVIFQGLPLASEFNLPPLQAEPFNYQLSISGWLRGDGQQQTACPFNAGQNINALAGISNPQKFFNQLEDLGLKVNSRPLADHAFLSATDLNFNNPYPVVLTAKDAVKLKPWLHNNHWVMQVHADLPKEFLAQVENQLAKLYKKYVNLPASTVSK